MLHWTNFVIYTKENYIYGNVEQEIEVKNSWVPHYLLQTQYFPKCIVVFPSSIKELCYFLSQICICAYYFPNNTNQNKSDKQNPKTKQNQQTQTR